MQKKILTKFNIYLWLKTQWSGYRGNIYLNIIKAIHDKPATNVILTNEKLKDQEQDKDAYSHHFYSV